MIKISCAPAKHFKALKNGAIRRQKTPVSDPLWRFAVVVGDVMFGRLFQEKPSLKQLSGCMDHVLDQSREVMGGQALMAMSLDKAIPGFAQRLQEKGLEVYVPRGSSGGLATVAKRWDKFLDTLGFCMTTLSEGDLTVDESTALAGNDVGIIGPIAHEKDVGAPQWRPNLDQELTDAAETINVNLANSLAGLTFAFGRPILM